MPERISSFIDPEHFDDPESGVRRLQVDPEEVACVANLAGLSFLTGEEPIPVLHRLTSFDQRKVAAEDILDRGLVWFCRVLDEPILSLDEFMYLTGQLAVAATETWDIPGPYRGKLRFKTVDDVRSYEPKDGDPHYISFLKKALAPQRPIVDVDIQL